jgi:DNA-binding transcriptional LysR family regulator
MINCLKLPIYPKFSVTQMSNPITFRHLRYFIATAETGKIQLAAEKVHMSPSAVADAIKSLEALLKTQLFHRGRTGVTLTYDGHRFLDNAQSILRLLDDSIFAFQNETVSVEGEITIGASVSVMGYFLPVPLSRFEKIYPNLKLTLIESTRRDLETQLLDGQIDIAFMITSNISISDSFEVETLFRSERTLWCSENHPLAEMERVPLADIAKEKYIMLVTDEAEVNINQIWRRYGRKPNIWVKTQSVEAVRSFIAREQGVAILSDLLYRPWSLDGTRLASKPVQEPVPTMNLGMVWLSNKKQSQGEKFFIDFLKHEVRQQTQSSDFRNIGL